MFVYIILLTYLPGWPPEVQHPVLTIFAQRRKAPGFHKRLEQQHWSRDLGTTAATTGSPTHRGTYFSHKLYFPPIPLVTFHTFKCFLGGKLSQFFSLNYLLNCVLILSIITFSIRFSCGKKYAISPFFSSPLNHISPHPPNMLFSHIFAPRGKQTNINPGWVILHISLPSIIWLRVPVEI